MRIESATAVFGKLDGQTLEFTPGLNVLHAPNEWGKSTWCAFFMAMFYGVETRSKSTRTALADKTHYAPWSGSPMSGRMAVNWNGRRITIERSGKSRTPMGNFRAYETETGLEVPELTAENCGEMLLGVERSVFRRAGFIRLTDMAVTADEDLRRRLNALVTTGEESDDGARLEKGLRELKNKCSRNPTGRLPQALEERERLNRALAQIRALEEEYSHIEQLQKENACLQEELENHLQSLAWRDALHDRQRVAEAEQAEAEAKARCMEAEKVCGSLPAPDLTRGHLEELKRLSRELDEVRRIPPNVPPAAPEIPAGFDGVPPEDGEHQASVDFALWKKRGASPWLLALGAVLLAAAGVMWISNVALAAGIAAAGAGLAVAAGLLCAAMGRKRRHRLEEKYGSVPPVQWQMVGRDYAGQMQSYRAALERCRSRTEAEEQQKNALVGRLRALCGGKSPEQCRGDWERELECWDTLARVRQQYAQTAQQTRTLKAMARPVPAQCPPSQRQETEAEAMAMLEKARRHGQRLREEQGLCRGKMETLGREETIRQQIQAVEDRVEALRRMEQALELAQQTLAQVREELQRRFAPPITKKAQEYMSAMTLGRYDRLRMDAAMTLHSGAQGESTLREALWRSDGTADQLYLALRLAVAQELTPDAPLILDDALVRFDDERLEAALHVLSDLAQTRQVIVFSCQRRESEILKI